MKPEDEDTLPVLPALASMPDELRCDPECRGWFLDGDYRAPMVCDECCAAAHKAGLVYEPPHDRDAFACWIEMVQDLVMDLVVNPEQERRVRKLFGVLS